MPARPILSSAAETTKATPEKALATVAIRNAYPQTIAETLGFRTASDKPPAK